MKKETIYLKRMPEEAHVVFKEQKVKRFQEAKNYKSSCRIMKMIPYALASTLMDSVDHALYERKLQISNLSSQTLSGEEV